VEAAFFAEDGLSEVFAPGIWYISNRFPLEGGCITVEGAVLIFADAGGAARPFSRDRDALRLFS